MSVPKDLLNHSAEQKTTADEIRKAIVERLKVLYPDYSAAPLVAQIEVEVLEPKEREAIGLKVTASFQITPKAKKETPQT